MHAMESRVLLRTFCVILGLGAGEWPPNWAGMLPALGSRPKSLWVEELWGARVCFWVPSVLVLGIERQVTPLGSVAEGELCTERGLK